MSAATGTALATAHRVLAWAGAPDPSAAPLPSGPLRAATALSEPDEAVLAAARSAARSTAARLGTGAPPFGDESRIGLGPVLLAAAVGGRAQPGPAARLAGALPPGDPDQPDADAPGHWSDAVARHAVVGPALRCDPGDLGPLTEALLRASPLTALLHRPPADVLADEDAGEPELTSATALLDRPRGRAVLVATLSGCTTDPLVLVWRARVLSALAAPGGRPDVAADTFLAARTRHGEEWDALLTATRRTLRAADGEPDSAALAVMRYWLPLADLRRRTDLVRERPDLLQGTRRTVELVEAYRRALTPEVIG